MRLKSTNKSNTLSDSISAEFTMTTGKSYANPRIFESVPVNENVSPIHGYLELDLLPLKDAVESLASQIPFLSPNVDYALDQRQSPPDDLTQDESASIYLYTMEDPKIYQRLNSTIQDKNRSKLKPWFSYMKLFHTALEHLPSISTMIARGVNRDLTADSNMYKLNNTFFWWRITSCTTALDTAQRFAEVSGKESTFFIIRCINGKKISNHSSFPDEAEIILMPGTRFRVTSDPIMLGGGTMRIIHLDEIPAHSLLSSSSSLPSASASKTAKVTLSKTNSVAQKEIPELSSIKPHSTAAAATKTSAQKVKLTDANGNTYFGEILNGQKHGRGVYTWADGSQYDGDWKEGVPAGYGVYKWADGDVFKGNFTAGKRDGKGVMTYADGGSYDGNWKNSSYQGYGVRQWASGIECKGNWENGEQEGRSIYTWPDGTQYDGEWKKGQRTGYGVYKWPDGNVYKGNWVAGNREGKGVLSCADGSKYDGNWKNSKKHGYGCTTWTDGGSYNGQYEDGEEHGEGTRIYKEEANGKRDRYTGMQRKGLRHGRGTYVWSDGNTYAGDWVEGKQTGKGVRAETDGTRYDGMWLDGKRHGRGTQTFDNGKYRGNWINDKQTGHGIFTWRTGNYYDGQWMENERHGAGSQYNTDGTVEQQVWEENRMISSTSVQNTEEDYSF